MVVVVVVVVVVMVVVVVVVVMVESGGGVEWSGVEVGVVEQEDEDECPIQSDAQPAIHKNPGPPPSAVSNPSRPDSALFQHLLAYFFVVLQSRSRSRIKLLSET